MLRLVLTRLVLPLAFIVAMVAIPFVWLPEVGPPPKGVSSPSPASPAGQVVSPLPAGRPAGAARRRPSPFQQTMTLGFALILVSVAIAGAMLYRITRDQTASWRRRFAPGRKGGGNRKAASP